jgi:hypothetical protein
LVPARENDVKRILKPLIWLLAAVYFLLDAVLLPVAGLISNWIGEHRMFCSLRAWVLSLRPYPTLLLFAVPVIVLEPVKPVGLYWIATGHVHLGCTVIVVGEILKLVLIERLFCISRDKLMSIPAFSWAYAKYRAALDWAASIEAWQAVRRFSLMAQTSVRRHLREWRASQGPRSLSSPSR